MFFVFVFFNSENYTIECGMLQEVVIKKYNNKKHNLFIGFFLYRLDAPGLNNNIKIVLTRHLNGQRAVPYG